MKKTLVVQYCRHSNTRTGYELTQAKDFTRSGMLFTTSRYHEAGELLNISFKLPFSGESLSVMGKVISCEDHIEGYNFGYKSTVKFVNVSSPKIQASINQTADFVWGREDQESIHQKQNTLRIKNTLVERAERVNKSLMFRYRPVNSNESPILNHAVNISGSGVLFRTEKPYSINDTLQLDFNLPTFDEPVKVYSKVARCVMLNQTIYDTAVQYDKISSYFQSAITDVLFDGLKEKENGNLGAKRIRAYHQAF